MRFSQLTFAAATASAMLVVPELSPEEEDGIFSILPFEDGVPNVPVNVASNTVSVPCRECLGEDSTIELNFEMDHGFLFVNDKLVYPELEGGFTAMLKLNDDGVYQDIDLGVAVAEGHLGVDEVQDMEAVELWFTISQINGVFMEDIPSVRLQMAVSRIQDEGYLGMVEVMEPNGPECDNLMCQVMEVFHKAVKKVKSMGKGCKGRLHHHGHHGHHGRPMMLSDEAEDHHHSGEHHHHPHHLLGKLIRGFIFQIFVPVMLGVVAGVSCGFIAMVLSTLVMKVVSRIRGRQQPAQIVLIEETVISEKARLMDDEELPEYEDSPEYEQSDDKQ